MTINMDKTKKYIKNHAAEVVAVASLIAVAGVVAYYQRKDFLHLPKDAAKHLAKQPGNVVYYAVDDHVYELMEVITKTAE